MVDEAHDAASLRSEAILAGCYQPKFTRRAMAEEEARKAAILAAGCVLIPNGIGESFCSSHGR
jgi:hypothetical protein